jgi:hypothetical protein
MHFLFAKSGQFFAIANLVSQFSVQPSGRSIEKKIPRRSDNKTNYPRSKNKFLLYLRFTIFLTYRDYSELGNS